MEHDSCSAAEPGRSLPPTQLFTMIILWGIVAMVVAIAGIHRLVRVLSLRASSRLPRIDDEALERIIRTGRIETDDEEPLDLNAAARAEEEFWGESWDEPEEYQL